MPIAAVVLYLDHPVGGGLSLGAAATRRASLLVASTRWGRRRR